MADTEPMIQAALSQLGVPYGWGQESPGIAFDCSGLVQWAAAQAGINLTRTTYTQVLEGQAATWPPVRGDLVFPDYGHVLIALSPTQGVHAPDVGQNVKVENFWFSNPVAVRRVGTNSGTTGAGVTALQLGNTIKATPAFSFPSIPGISTITDFLTSSAVRILKITGGMAVLMVSLWYFGTGG